MNEGTETDSDADAPAAEYLDDFELPDAWSTQLPEDPLDKTLDELENSSASIHSRENRQSSISVDDEGSNHFEKDLFSCVLLAYKRQFKGQSSGSYIARWQVSAHSTTSFIRKVWNLAKEHLNREVIFDVKADGTTSPVWAENESPSEKEFGKFVLFQSGRRHYVLEKLTESSNLLQSWRNKEITVLLHVYSLSVSNRTVWSSVKENLIDPSERDRSGAATTQAVIGLADELRSVHGKHLDAHGMAWSFWANSILNGPAHLRESLKDHPPQHLAHLFRVKEGLHVNAIRRELTVAHSVNNSYHEEVVALRQVFDVVESNVECLNASLKMFKTRLEALELRDRLSDSMINAMETAVKVQEDDLGQELKSKIIDMEDMDHM
ncbi:uncharacterized protein LOC110676970 [Aedes aegypti]|uniref:Uncharacterized protein n=1 Tax=Aedes aegypti TaxID=7159 RepID=A0A6I8U9X8_AEDAE|nr:uncharacterized protein LOC110676970 [Aedes aegypti]